MTQGKVFVFSKTYLAFFDIVDAANREDVAGAVFAHVQ
jgi:hypothetical protein